MASYSGSYFIGRARVWDVEGALHRLLDFLNHAGVLIGPPEERAAQLLACLRRTTAAAEARCCVSSPNFNFRFDIAGKANGLPIKALREKEGDEVFGVQDSLQTLAVHASVQALFPAAIEYSCQTPYRLVTRVVRCCARTALGGLRRVPVLYFERYCSPWELSPELDASYLAPDFREWVRLMSGKSMIPDTEIPRLWLCPFVEEFGRQQAGNAPSIAANVWIVESLGLERHIRLVQLREWLEAKMAALQRLFGQLWELEGLTGRTVVNEHIATQEGQQLLAPSDFLHFADKYMFIGREAFLPPEQLFVKSNPLCPASIRASRRRKSAAQGGKSGFNPAKRRRSSIADLPAAEAPVAKHSTTKAALAGSHELEAAFWRTARMQWRRARRKHRRVLEALTKLHCDTRKQVLTLECEAFISSCNRADACSEEECFQVNWPLEAAAIARGCWPASCACSFLHCNPHHCDSAATLSEWTGRLTPQQHWAELPCLGLPAAAYRLAEMLFDNEAQRFSQRSRIGPVDGGMTSRVLTEGVKAALLDLYGGYPMPQMHLHRRLGCLFASRTCRLGICEVPIGGLLPLERCHRPDCSCWGPTT